MSSTFDTKELNNVIVGRVEPRIYAFLTTSVPRYLKVGDTYRPVPVRIAEWQKHFEIDAKENVWDWPAVLKGDVFFRDYSVHQFLQNSKNLIRLDKKTLATISKGRNLYFSNEFFLDASAKNVEEAIEDIKEDYKQSSGKYLFYSTADIDKNKDDEQLPDPVNLDLRPNQKEAVERFKTAWEKEKRTNLLMYAVMRFGKTVTALRCAQEMKANFIVVVSGKADVAREWKNTIAKFKDFSEAYVFLSKKDLETKYTRVAEELKAHHKVVLFATLQDLQGDAIKPKHEQIFSNQIDLLIIDETHFAARAEKYGKALRIPKKYEVADKSEESCASEVLDTVKNFHAKVRLHLSGTPYRILMGSEFQANDIVSFCQFTDIARAQKTWNEQFLFKNKTDKDGKEILDENGEPVPYEEWDNPYYGFPQMVRFAFNLNETARKILEEQESKGVTSRFGELFRPMSMEKDSSIKQLHRKFMHEKEVVDLFRAIGGSSDDPNIFPFLKYEKIENGQMCHHIVCVLPYCASCDALEALLDGSNEKYKGTFGKLGEYKIINISGIEVKKGFVKIADIVRTISECEQNGIKTITLTVNRMLTGSTVPEWDTMLFLKDTSSPQEYDQAIFRLQSSFIRPMTDKNGRCIKFNMKPQTLLVDFDPMRMFRLQEARAQIYNINIARNGNRELEERVAQELKVSPIIQFNKDRIHQVQASDVMKAISQYSSKRGVAEEVEEIPVDTEIYKDPKIRAFIDNLPELGSKNGLTIAPHEGEKTDVDLGENALNSDNDSSVNNVSGELPPKDSKELNSVLKRIKTYHALIVFYSFLVPERVQSLDEILQVIDKNENNKRIAAHLELEKNLLELYRKSVNWDTLQKLDYKIQNLDRLANEDDDIDLGEEYKGVPKNVKKAIVAMTKFGRLGETKIVTPPNIAYDMVKQIPADELKQRLTSNEKVLDLASKMGEFAIAVVRRCAEPDIGLSNNDLKESIFSIPMCGITYEFTRKVYELLELDVKCIAESEKLNSYDLLKIKKENGRDLDYERIRNLLTQNTDFNQISISDDVAENGENMCKKIGLVISNPPYQEKGASGGTNDAPIYQDYCQIGAKVTERYSSFIIKAAWTSTGRDNLVGPFRRDMTSCRELRSMTNYIQADNVFPDTEIKGGICYYFRDGEYKGDCDYTLIQDKKVQDRQKRDLSEFDVIVRDPRTSEIVKKVLAKAQNDGLGFISSKISADTPFGIPTNPEGSKNNPFVVSDKKTDEFDTILFYLKNRSRCTAFVRSGDIVKNAADVKFDKVFIPGAYGAGEGYPHQILGEPEIAPKNSACSQTYLYAKFKSHVEAKNFASYLKTRFCRILVSAIKITQHSQDRVFRFVPVQDFTSASDIDWNRPISKIDEQLYAKYDIADHKSFIESMIKPME